MPRSIVRLPEDVAPPFQVYVSGVPQAEGRDFRVRGRELVFERELVKEGRVAFWRWLIGAFGVGTYRRDDSVDVRYEVAGQPRLAEGLEIKGEQPPGRAAASHGAERPPLAAHRRRRRSR